jgi:hypothetical protein
VFRPGSDDSIDGGAGRLVPVGPDVTVRIEGGLGAGMAQSRLNGLDVSA